MLVNVIVLSEHDKCFLKFFRLLNAHKVSLSDEC